MWRRRLEEERLELELATGAAHERAEKAMRDSRVHPVDAPRGSLRARLMKQMTATESSSKTAACDLLYNLCSDEGTKNAFERDDAMTETANLPNEAKEPRCTSISRVLVQII